ncbi:MAG: Ig-like domain-containing protein [Lachnospiraceae bacterium]|nr:Ig-like domain-containing protein [Lachnospiraceae bacterium]
MKIQKVLKTIFFCFGMLLLVNGKAMAADVTELEGAAQSLSLDQKVSGTLSTTTSNVYKIVVPTAETNEEFCLAASSLEGNVALTVYDQEGEEATGLINSGTSQNPVLKGTLTAGNTYYITVYGPNIDISRDYNILWAQEKSMLGMSVSQYPRETFYKDLDVGISYAGLQLTIYYSDGSEETVTSGDMTKIGYLVDPVTTLDMDQCQVGDVEGVTITLGSVSTSYIVSVADFSEVDAIELKEEQQNVTAANSNQAQKFVFKTGACGHIKLNGEDAVLYRIYEKEADGSRGALVESWNPYLDNTTEKEFSLSANTEYYLLTYLRSGKASTAYSITASFHNWDNGTVTTEPTCTTAGEKTYHCTNEGCTDTKTESITATGHKWDNGTITKTPTCTTAGEKTYHCTNEGCTETRTESIAATGHKWDNGTITKTPTCTTTGEKTYHCTNSGCSETKTESIAATGHTAGEWTIEKAATCTTAGSRVKKCTSCGTVLQRETIVAIGHSFGEWTTKEATIFEDGYRVRQCSVCGTEEKVRISKLSSKVTLNASSVPLQLKKSTTAIKIKSYTKGDKVSKWTSSNTKIISVNAKNGKITAKKTGKAYVIVTMQSGATAKCKITVQKGAVKTTKVFVNKTSVTLKLKGGSKTFTIVATRTPVTSTEKITYTSSNKKIAAVNSKGKITAKKAGKATITVKAGKKTKKIKVTVKKK